MTAADLVGILARRWYLMVAGGLVWIGVLLLSVQSPPVHWTQFEVVLLPPREPVHPNSLEAPAYDITPMAGVIVADLNDGRHSLELASSGTTLYGEGLRAGHRVRLRDLGTQWQPVYDPVIDVQVVGPAADQVMRQCDMLVSQLAEILRERQASLGVVPASRMTLQSSPSDPVIHQVGGSRTRSAGAITLLGATSTTILVVWADAFLLRRRDRHRRPQEAT